LKNGQEAGEQSIKEAAEFAGIYSALWKEGKHSGEVYYVKPEQVKRAARPGEYLPKGSFFIEGKRNYVTVEMKAAIGVDISNLRLLGGPVEGVRKHCDHYVVIEIGDVDFNQFSIQVAKKLVEVAGDEEKHIVRSIATPDEVAKFLPPGRSRIVEAK
ncbi:MAG: fibronectin-binding domain-containing protein, partial [Archaeoglobi archaeon]|nr:fibronectin-binding domain-containing protein [Archaeoglobi archaeon]